MYSPRLSKEATTLRSESSSTGSTTCLESDSVSITGADFMGQTKTLFLQSKSGRVHSFCSGKEASTCSSRKKKSVYIEKGRITPSFIQSFIRPFFLTLQNGIKPASAFISFLLLKAPLCLCSNLQTQRGISIPSSKDCSHVYFPPFLSK